VLQLRLPDTNEILDFRVGLETAVGKILAKDGISGFEPETLAACCAIIETEKVLAFADIGANIGIFTLVLGKMFPGLAIKAFEPLPWLNATAKSLCQDNGVRADIREEAVSDREGTATLYISAQSDSSNSLNPRFRPSKGEIQVPVVTLDALTARQGFFPKLVKIDTESTEPDVLAGARKFIENTRPWIICEVLAGRTEFKLNKFVREIGYSAYSLKGSKFNRLEEIEGDPSYQYRDWLFAPNIISTSLIQCYAKWVNSFETLKT